MAYREGFSFKHIQALAVLLMFFCVTPVRVMSQEVDEIIGKHLEALGGKERLSKLESSVIVAVFSMGEDEIVSTTTVLQNKGFRTEQQFRGMTMVQAFDGETAWAINPALGNGGAVKLPESYHKTVSRQMDLTGLYNYKEKGYRVSRLEDEVVDGTPVYVLEVTSPDGNKSTNYISKSTFYTVKSSFRVELEEKAIVSHIYLSDYRETEGYVTPFTIEIAGQIPGRIITRVRSIRYNAPVDPAIFSFPGN